MRVTQRSCDFVTKPRLCSYAVGCPVVVSCNCLCSRFYLALLLQRFGPFLRVGSRLNGKKHRILAVVRVHHFLPPRGL